MPKPPAETSRLGGSVRTAPGANPISAASSNTMRDTPARRITETKFSGAIPPFQQTHPSARNARANTGPSPSSPSRTFPMPSSPNTRYGTRCVPFSPRMASASRCGWVMITSLPPDLMKSTAAAIFGPMLPAGNSPSAM